MMFQSVKVSIIVGLGMSFAALGQSAPNSAQTGAAAAPAPSTSMGILQPAVISLQQAMDLLRADKWKASKDVKTATADNIGSIRKDVEVTLPGLVTAADAAPESLAAMLPVARNAGALYDVVLRVTVIAESAAPGDQADALEKALKGLESARRTLADRAQDLAAGEEAKVGDLQRQLNARPAVAAVCPPVLAPVPVKTTSTVPAKRKKKVVKRAAQTPAGSGPS